MITSLVSWWRRRAHRKLVERLLQERMKLAEMQAKKDRFEVLAKQVRHPCYDEKCADLAGQIASKEVLIQRLNHEVLES